MRRAEREIKDWDGILDVLRRADTIRLGLHGDQFPYVVPVSFGFEDCGGQIVIYIHGAREGLKHKLIDINNNVCVEADIFHRYAETDTGVTAEYESVIGFGAANVIKGEEAVRGLDLICSHCGYHGYIYDKAAPAHMRIYRITLSSVTGKRRFV